MKKLIDFLLFIFKRVCLDFQRLFVKVFFDACELIIHLVFKSNINNLNWNQSLK